MLTINKLIEELNKTYTKANLEIFYDAFLKNFIVNNTDRLKKQGILVNFLNNTKQPSKAELIPAYAVVLYDKELFQLFLKAMPAPLPDVWKGLLLDGAVLHSTLEKRYNVKIAENKSTYSLKLELDPHYYGIPHSAEFDFYSYGTKDNFKVMFFLPPETKRHLLTLIDIPEEYHLMPLDAPAQTQFLYEDNHAIMEEFPLFVAYYQQGDLKYSSSGKSMAASVNKMRKFCNSREFFPEDKDRKDLMNLRTQLVAQALPLAGKAKQLTGSVPDMLQQIIRSFAAGKLSVLFHLLFHLKGSGYVKNNYEDSRVNLQLVSIIKSLPPDAWLDLNNLHRHVSLFYGHLMPVSQYTADQYLYLEVLEEIGNSASKERYNIEYDMYEESISIPLLKATMFFMAALGMADIAFDYPKDALAEEIGRDYISVWDGLRAVRLTPLGAFVLGQKSFYEPPQKEKSGELYLEEDRLLINYTGDDKIIAMMLDKVASKSTATRYKTDYQTFLKDCITRTDIENKIAVFREHIEARPPQVWEDFFQELLNKYNPFKKDNKLRVFQIPADNKELIGLLARDEVLKKLVVKAEHYYILVEEKNMGAVRARLLHYGFLLERGKK